MKNETLKSSLILLLIFIVTALLLFGVNLITKPVIENNAAARRTAAQMALLPQAEWFEDLPEMRWFGYKQNPDAHINALTIGFLAAKLGEPGEANNEPGEISNEPGETNNETGETGGEANNEPGIMPVGYIVDVTYAKGNSSNEPMRLLVGVDLEFKITGALKLTGEGGNVHALSPEEEASKAVSDIEAAAFELVSKTFDANNRTDLENEIAIVKQETNEYVEQHETNSEAGETGDSGEVSAQ